jgi:5-methylthioadenosine/S-adenosylhomocysteine deaminase
MSPTRALESIGLFNGRTLAAHAVWMDGADLEILRIRHVGVAHCPSSNMKLASGVAPVLRMRSLGINVGLGPDGPAGSNNDLDMFEEMDLAAKLQKVMSQDPQSLPASAVFDMATMGGARALGLEREIGSLEPGKRADIISVSLDQPHAAPMYEPLSQMVYALKSSDVRDVMVNGKQVVQDRRILTMDLKQVRAKAEEFQIRIKASLKR